jgi:hypothetical protein
MGGIEATSESAFCWEVADSTSATRQQISSLNKQELFGIH